MACGNWNLEIGETTLLPNRYNGKPVYAKLIDFGQLPDSGTKSLAHGVSDMDAFGIMYDRSWVEQSNGTRYALDHPNTTADAYWRTSLDTINVMIRVGMNRSVEFRAFVCIWYTKTTDQPVSDAGPNCEDILLIAERAEQKADVAQSTADAARSRADDACLLAEDAKDSATTAKASADAATDRAESALGSATQARTRADEAYNLAQTAQAQADNALAVANTAVSGAQAAQSTADRALVLAENAVPKTGITTTSNALLNEIQALSTLTLDIDSPNAINISASGSLTVHAEPLNQEICKPVLLTIAASDDTAIVWPASLTWRGEEGPDAIPSGTRLVVSVLFVGCEIIAEIVHRFRPGIVVPPEPELKNILLPAQNGYVAYGSNPDELVVRQVAGASGTAFINSAVRRSDGMLMVVGLGGEVAWGYDPARLSFASHGQMNLGGNSVFRQSDGMLMFASSSGKIVYGDEPSSLHTVERSLGLVSKLFCRQSDGMFFIGGGRGLFYGQNPWALDVLEDFPLVRAMCCRDRDGLLYFGKDDTILYGHDPKKIVQVSNQAFILDSICRQSDGMFVSVSYNGLVRYGTNPATMKNHYYGNFDVYTLTVRESDGMIVAVGTDGSVLYGTEPGALVYKQYPTPALTYIQCRSDGMFVATGQDNTILYGSDPASMMPKRFENIKFNTSHFSFY